MIIISTIIGTLFRHTHKTQKEDQLTNLGERPKVNILFLWKVIPKMQRSIFPDKMQQNIFMDNIQRGNKTRRQLDNETTTITRQWQPIPTNGSDNNACLHLRRPKSQKHDMLSC